MEEIRIENERLHLGKKTINIKDVVSFNYTRPRRSFFEMRIIHSSYTALFLNLIFILGALSFIVYNLFKDIDVLLQIYHQGLKPMVVHFQNFSLEEKILVVFLMLVLMFLFVFLPIIIIRESKLYVLEIVRYGKAPIVVHRGKKKGNHSAI